MPPRHCRFHYYFAAIISYCDYFHADSPLFSLPLRYFAILLLLMPLFSLSGFSLFCCLFSPFSLMPLFRHYFFRHFAIYFIDAATPLSPFHFTRCYYAIAMPRAIIFMIC
jgi:hypothetical protein